jgi:hypothetical protein
MEAIFRCLPVRVPFRILLTESFHS